MGGRSPRAALLPSAARRLRFAHAAVEPVRQAPLKGRNQQAAAWRRDPSRRADASSRRGGAPWLNNATRNGTCGSWQPRRPAHVFGEEAQMNKRFARRTARRVFATATWASLGERAPWQEEGVDVHVLRRDRLAPSRVPLRYGGAPQRTQEGPPSRGLALGASP